VGGKIGNSIGGRAGLPAHEKLKIIDFVSLSARISLFGK